DVRIADAPRNRHRPDLAGYRSPEPVPGAAVPRPSHGDRSTGLVAGGGVETPLADHRIGRSTHDRHRGAGCTGQHVAEPPGAACPGAAYPGAGADLPARAFTR